jgi:hypothetical protein
VQRIEVVTREVGEREIVDGVVDWSRGSEAEYISSSGRA